MKKLISVSFFIAAVLCSSCSEKNISDDFVEMDDVISISKVFTVDVQTKSGESKPAMIFFSATYSIADDTVLKSEFTIDDDSIDEEAYNEAIVDLLKQKFGDNCYDIAAIENYIMNDPGEDFSLGDCIKGCNSDFKKGDGRGACRFQCWAKEVVDIAKEIGVTLRILFEAKK